MDSSDLSLVKWWPVKFYGHSVRNMGYKTSRTNRFRPMAPMKCRRQWRDNPAPSRSPRSNPISSDRRELRCGRNYASSGAQEGASRGQRAACRRADLEIEANARARQPADPLACEQHPINLPRSRQALCRAALHALRLCGSPIAASASPGSLCQLPRSTEGPVQDSVARLQALTTARAKPTRADRSASSSKARSIGDVAQAGVAARSAFELAQVRALSGRRALGARDRCRAVNDGGLRSWCGVKSSRAIGGAGGIEADRFVPVLRLLEE
jgi:hypothetical protein